MNASGPYYSNNAALASSGSAHKLHEGIDDPKTEALIDK